jgi:uncharacterized membrane protein YkvA (DUF1232 family)
MEGEVVPMPDREPERPEVVDNSLAIVQHPLDTSVPVPVRSRQEILREAVLLVPNLAKLLFRLLKDRRVPLRRRLAMGAVGLYVASPIDLIPDAIPVVGGVDDLLLLAFAVDYLIDASPDDVVAEYWDGSEDGLEVVRGIAAWGVEMMPARLRRLLGRI